MSHKPSKSEKAASSTSRREEFERVFGPMLRAMRSWAFNEGIALHPRHVEGLALTYVTLMREAARTGDDLGPSLGRTLEDLDQLIAKRPEEERVELEAACAQARQFISSFDSPAAFAAATGGL